MCTVSRPYEIVDAFAVLHSMGMIFRIDHSKMALTKPFTQLKMMIFVHFFNKTEMVFKTEKMEFNDHIYKLLLLNLGKEKKQCFT